jgi:membrane associated rhomboid family serine protease
MTYILLILTAIISIAAFNNDKLFSRLMLNPYQVYHRKEYYRVISHGFIHADWVHLIVNMLVFFSFGTAVEQYFELLAEKGILKFPKVWFMFLYLAGIIISSSTTIYKYRDNVMYNSVGASGAVSAVLFCSIFFGPFESLYLYGIIKLPGIVFGILYLIYSQYMSKKNLDNVNHDAHFIGAVFGFLFPLIINYKLIQIFINQLSNWSF